MNLIRTTNGYSCLACAAASLFNISMKEMTQALGHDGSEIIWPHSLQPWRGFTMDEIVLFAVENDLRPVWIAFKTIIYRDGEIKIVNEWDTHQINSFLIGKDGILIASVASNIDHALVWKAGEAGDPKTGTVAKYPTLLYDLKGLLWIE